MAFDHGAKKIVLTCVSPSPVLSSQVRKFRTQIIGHASVLAPKDTDGSPAKTSEWLRENAEKADLIIVFFMSSKRLTAAILPPASGDRTPPRTAKELLHVSAPELADLPGNATVLVALSSAADREELPKELAAYRFFDLSSDDAREALLCAVAHEPVRAKRKSFQEAAGAVFKIVIGYIATLVGNFDKTREFFVENVNETVGLALHYCMIAGVAVLLFTGFWSLLQLAVDTVAPTLKLETLRRIVERLPGGRSRWVKVTAGLVAAAIVLASLRFMPNRLHAETLVEQHMGQWVDRLERSQMENGGIREHLNHGVAQAWVTGQAAVALLSAKEYPTSRPLDVQRAIAFFERTRIADVVLKDGARDRLAAELSSVFPQTDFSKLPARFPSVAMATSVVGWLGARRELSVATMQFVDTKVGEHFTVTPASEGWGYFEQFDAGITEITAWVTLAQIHALRAKDRARWSEEQHAVLKNRIKTNIASFEAREIPGQRNYSPVSDTSDPAFGRTYSTIMVLWALSEAAASDVQIFDAAELSKVHLRIGLIVDWLDWKAAEDGWKVNPSNPTADRPFVGLTNQTLCILTRVPVRVVTDRENLKKVKRSMLQRAPTWRTKGMNDNDRAHDSDRYLYPTRHVVESSTFLWYPWSVCAMRALSSDMSLSSGERRTAERAYRDLRARSADFSRFVQGEAQYNYVAAEGLIAFTWPR